MREGKPAAILRRIHGAQQSASILVTTLDGPAVMVAADFRGLSLGQKRNQLIGRLAREYDWTLGFLDANWVHIEVLADALLDLGTICPMRFVAALPELGSPRR